MLQRTPNAFQEYAARMSAHPDNGDHPSREPYWPPTPASTLRSRKRRARLKQKDHRRNPSRYVSVMLHETEIDALSLAVKVDQLVEYDTPTPPQKLHDEIAATVRTFVIKELKRRNLL